MRSVPCSSIFCPSRRTGTQFKDENKDDEMDGPLGDYAVVHSFNSAKAIDTSNKWDSITIHAIRLKFRQ